MPKNLKKKLDTWSCVLTKANIEQKWRDFCQWLEYQTGWSFIYLYETSYPPWNMYFIKRWISFCTNKFLILIRKCHNWCIPTAAFKCCQKQSAKILISVVKFFSLDLSCCFLHASQGAFTHESPNQGSFKIYRHKYILHLCGLCLPILDIDWFVPSSDWPSLKRNEFLNLALRLPKKQLMADWTAKSWVNFSASYTHTQMHTQMHTHRHTITHTHCQLHHRDYATATLKE